MNTITLFHGSANKIENFIKGRMQGMYFTENIKEANDYILAQADGKTGSYGFIYKVVIDKSNIELTDDIDNSIYSENIYYSPEETYYRIDNMDKYELIELTEEEIESYF